jgi:hypothetical protein
MKITLAVLKYRNPDGSVNYGLHFADCVGRFERLVADQLSSFDELCSTIRTTMTDWHKPRREAPANLEIKIRDEGDYPGEERRIQPVTGALLLHFHQDEKRELSLIALTATADAAA